MSNINLTFQTREHQVISMIETYLGYRVNSRQITAIERLMQANPQELISCPMPRRGGKTALAVALMKAVSDAITIVRYRNIIELCDEEIRSRTFLMHDNTIHGLSPSLIIFDEIHDMGYIERLRQEMPRTKLLQLYTPDNENTTILSELEKQLSRIMQRYREESKRQDDYFQELEISIADVLLQENKSIDKKENKEWDNYENSYNS